MSFVLQLVPAGVSDFVPSFVPLEFVPSFVAPLDDLMMMYECLCGQGAQIVERMVRGSVQQRVIQKQEEERQRTGTRDQGEREGGGGGGGRRGRGGGGGGAFSPPT